MMKIFKKVIGVIIAGFGCALISFGIHAALISFTNWQMLLIAVVGIPVLHVGISLMLGTSLRKVITEAVDGFLPQGEK